MQKVGLIGWRGMVGSVLMERMQQENVFLIDATFFSTSQAGQKAPLMARIMAYFRMLTILKLYSLWTSLSPLKVVITHLRCISLYVMPVGKAIGYRVMHLLCNLKMILELS